MHPSSSTEAFELRGTGSLITQVAEHYRVQIRSGKLQPGDRLPVCLELGQALGLSPQTINRAFDILAKEGLVYRRRSVGTIVGNAPVPGSGAAVAPGRRLLSSAKPIGIVVEPPPPGKDGEFGLIMADYLNGLIEGATLHRLRFEVVYSQPGQSHLEKVQESLKENRFSGLVNMYLSEEATDYLLGAKFPMVGLNIDLSGSQVPSVIADQARGFGQAWKYVEELGHRRVGFVGFQNRNIKSHFEFSAGRELAQAQADLLPFLLLSGGEDAKSIRELLLTRLGKHDPNTWPTLFFTQTDLIAVGLIKALQELGLRVPDDVSVIGFNDTSIASSHRPSLTTLVKPRRAMAEAAAHLLANVLAGRPGSQEHLQVFPLKLVQRETCAPPPKAG